MSKAILNIERWGNRLAIRLPTVIAREARLHLGQRVQISVKQGRVMIAPLGEASRSLEQRLERFDPARHGGEAMSSAEPLGSERY